MCVGMRFAELTALLTLIRLYQRVSSAAQYGSVCMPVAGAGRPARSLTVCGPGVASQRCCCGVACYHAVSCLPASHAYMLLCRAACLYTHCRAAHGSACCHPVSCCVVHVPPAAGPGAAQDQSAYHPGAEHEGFCLVFLLITTNVHTSCCALCPSLSRRHSCVAAGTMRCVGSCCSWVARYVQGGWCLCRAAAVAAGADAAVPDWLQGPIEGVYVTVHKR